VFHNEIQKQKTKKNLHTPNKQRNKQHEQCGKGKKKKHDDRNK
jgi:hypothetical protein